MTGFFCRVHYTGSYSPAEAKNSGTPLWSSEDYAASDDEDGGGCVARVSTFSTSRIFFSAAFSRSSTRKSVFQTVFKNYSDVGNNFHVLF